MTDDHKRKKKKRGRSKFFKFCFRSEDGPPPPSSSSSSSDKSDGRNDNNNGRLGKPELIAVSGRQGRDFIPDGDLVNGCDNGGGDDCGAKRSSSRRRISRVLKAVLFNAKLKKNRNSSSKSSISSETSSPSLSNIEKVCKTMNDGNAYVREYPEMDDSCSRRSNLFSSSSRTTSSAYSTSSRTTSSAYSSSTLSSINSNSRSLFDLKTSSRIDPLDFVHHPVSSNSSNLKKSNPINSNSYRTDSPHFRSQSSSKSLTSSKSIPQSLSHQKGLSRLDSTNSVSSNNMLILMNPNSDKIMFGGNNWNIRWCLFLLLSLVVLVIWGRIFSILCTSIWFYFVPCQRIRRVDSVTNMAECGGVDTESKHYKKRVIMAGLLERTRNPIR